MTETTYRYRVEMLQGWNNTWVPVEGYGSLDEAIAHLSRIITKINLRGGKKTEWLRGRIVKQVETIEFTLEANDD